jgi:3-oxoacyl-[acyl-carrier protein] reductase
MDDWRLNLELNLFAAYAQSRAAIPFLRPREGGKILFMGSGVGRNAMPGTRSYACSKAGVAILCRVLARELREDDIPVNEIIPGPVRTEMTGVPEEWIKIHRKWRRWRYFSPACPIVDRPDNRTA